MTQYLYLLPYVLLVLMWARNFYHWPLREDRIFTAIVTLAATAIALVLGWITGSSWIAGTIVAVIVTIFLELLTWYVEKRVFRNLPDEGNLACEQS